MSAEAAVHGAMGRPDGAPKNSAVSDVLCQSSPQPAGTVFGHFPTDSSLEFQTRVGLRYSSVWTIGKAV